MFVIGLLNIGFFSILSAYAQITAATTRVTILVYTMPIWAVLLAWAVLRERPNARQALAIVLCALGLAVLIYPLAKGGVPLGLLLAVAAGTTWGAGTVYVKWTRLELDPLAATFWQLVIAFLMIAGCLIAVDGRFNVDHAHTGSMLAAAFAGIPGLDGNPSRAQAQARHAVDPVGRIHRAQSGRLPLFPLPRAVPQLGGQALGHDARQTHMGGDKLFVDYAGDTVPVIVDRLTGETRQAQIFVAVLGASNFTYAEANWTQGLSDWIGAHTRAFAAIGGVPRLLVPDNAKVAVIKACLYEPQVKCGDGGALRHRRAADQASAAARQGQG